MLSPTTLCCITATVRRIVKLSSERSYSLIWSSNYQLSSFYRGCWSLSESNLKQGQTMKLSREESPDPDKPNLPSCSSSSFSDKLVVVVLGSTASGKSKLAIDLARQVNGEIISADSMQVYEGLDILTNKETEEEKKGVPHHMISAVKRTETFNVTQFKDLALPLVERILSDGKVPVIVGGTNYYIESIIWNVLMEDRADDNQNQSTPLSDLESDYKDSVFLPTKKLKGDPQFLLPNEVDKSDPDLTVLPALTFMEARQGNFKEAELVSKWTSVELHLALQKVDPPRASKIHPNDSRKVVRSLQVYFRTGRKHSDLIEEQFVISSDSEVEVLDGEEEDGFASRTPTSLTGRVGGPMRFPNSICFWIQADKDILNKRIEDRVDKMVERGMKLELDAYIDHARKENWKWDFEEGQLQSIGVKEFRSYIELTPEERVTEAGQKSLEEGLERLKIVTRQYAKRQVSWIKHRFLKSSRRKLPRVYGLNGNDVDSQSWEANVTNPAIEILTAHLRNELDAAIITEKLLPVLDEDEGKPQDFISRKCEVCDKVLLGSLQYDEHMRSSKHWKVVKRKKKVEENKAKLRVASAKESESATTLLEQNLG